MSSLSECPAIRRFISLGGIKSVTTLPRRVLTALEVFWSNQTNRDSVIGGVGGAVFTAVIFWLAWATSGWTGNRLGD